MHTSSSSAIRQGILLPMAAESCTLREAADGRGISSFAIGDLHCAKAVIMGSVLAKASVPVMHERHLAAGPVSVARATSAGICFWRLPSEVAASIVRLCAPHLATVNSTKLKVWLVKHCDDMLLHLASN